MLSKSEKVEWHCPECFSKNIYFVLGRGPKSGGCSDCNTWWPWRTRIKKSRGKKCRK